MNRTSKAVCVVGVLLLLGAGVSFSQAESGVEKSPVQGAGAEVVVPTELKDSKYLFEVVRQVYRWNLDEYDVDRLSGTTNFPFWVRLVEGQLDKGDHSQIAEIVMPLVGTSVRVKKPDYRIEELNVTVTGSTFRITNVSKIGIPAEPLAAHLVINVSYAEMREYLFRTRADVVFPDAGLTERLRVAVRTEMGLHPTARTAGRQIIHIAPLSPVANEVWVYWENRQVLIRFSSDIDLVNPAVWAHETLMVKTWDVRTQVVVSLDEAAGSNGFMTRDQIGRALYNCIVLGKRMEATHSESDPRDNSEK